MNKEIYEKIAIAQKEIEAKRNGVLELRAQLEPEEVADYELLDFEEKPVKLSALFDERNELMVIHNMGKGCSYCTLWADGFNGFAKPLNDRVPFVLVSPDKPSVQKEFAESRGWTFKMLSGSESTFTKDLGFEKEERKFWPGVSTFVRKEGKLFRVNYDFFGPGDSYCSVWHLFDLLPEGENGWKPKYTY